MEAVAQWLILAIAIAVGWGLGRFSKRETSKSPGILPSEDALKERLKLFFNAYSDETIENFVNSLPVNSETVSMHLSIGAHFRKKGEVEKATLIHRNLLAHPELSSRVSDEVTFELSKDYMAAGLLDRAEVLLLDLRKSPHYSVDSSKLLLGLYEQEKEWQEALDVLATLDARRYPWVTVRNNHYLCELAQIAIDQDDWIVARSYLRKALAGDRHAVRANLTLAELEYRAGNYAESVAILKKIVAKNPVYIHEVLEPMGQCAEATGSHEAFLEYMRGLFQQVPQSSILTEISRLLNQSGKTDEALLLLQGELKTAPSLRGLNDWAELVAIRERGQVAGEFAEAVRGLTTTLLARKPVYQCESCGFAGQQLHWQCPSCKKWETIKPIMGLEGE